MQDRRRRASRARTARLLWTPAIAQYAPRQPHLAEARHEVAGPRNILPKQRAPPSTMRGPGTTEALRIITTGAARKPEYAWKKLFAIKA